MFLLSWWYSLMLALGLYQKTGRLLLLGLDHAGKTTLLHMLRDNRVVAHLPTQRATKETLAVGGVEFDCYDLGGHEEAREVWADYYVDASAIIYMVDAYDRGRFAESKVQLDALLTDGRLAEVPIVVLANKIDLPRAASESEVRQALGMVHTSGKGGSTHGRPIELFMCSVVQRSGYADGIRWLANFL